MSLHHLKKFKISRDKLKSIKGSVFFKYQIGGCLEGCREACAYPPVFLDQICAAQCDSECFTH